MIINIEPKDLSVDEIKRCLNGNIKTTVAELTDIEFENARHYTLTKKNYCFCNKGFGKSFDTVCPYCFAHGTSTNLFANTASRKLFAKKAEGYCKELEKEPNARQAEYNKAYVIPDIKKAAKISRKKKIFNGYLVSKHPSYSYGIVIKFISIKCSFDEDKNVLTLSDILNGYVEIVPGNYSKAYKIVDGKKEEVQAFEALNIKPRDFVSLNVPIVWENAAGGIGFLYDNKDFVNRTGILDVLEAQKMCQSFDGFILLFCSIYASYPVIEQLAKMGMTNLVLGAVTQVGHSWTKANADAAISGLGRIFNPHGTSGKTMLPLPKYATTYLRDMNASLSLIDFWINIFEIEKISKEDFLEVNSLFIESNFCLGAGSYYYNMLVDLLKHGYKIKKLLKYILKDSSAYNIYLLRDYHEMAELMHVEPQLYPVNLRAAHDNLMQSYQLHRAGLSAKVLEDIADEAAKFIPKDEAFKDYVIVIPRTPADFAKEGSDQHNCVASYVQNVANKRDFVFFIRRATEPDVSYITAEYRNGRIQQLMEKNNFSTKNSKAISFANEFASKLKATAFFRGI